MVSESLGIIEPQFFKFEGDFELESGKILEGFNIIYETYGNLNEKKSKNFCLTIVDFIIVY